jgi:hypothetical protein
MAIPRRAAAAPSRSWSAKLLSQHWPGTCCSCITCVHWYLLTAGVVLTQPSALWCHTIVCLSLLTVARCFLHDCMVGFMQATKVVWVVAQGWWWWW